MKEILEDMAAFLQNSGYGTIGVQIFTKSLPDSPVKAYGVMEGGPGINVSPAMDKFPVTIWVRNKNKDAAEVDAQAIWLLTKNGWNILPTIPCRVEATTQPNLMRDLANFPLYVFNVEVLTGHYRL